MKKILPVLIVFVVSLNSFSQNVGIGTNTPTSKLSIEGSDNSTQSKNAVIQLTNTASTNTWYIRAGSVNTFTPAGGFSIGDKTSNRLILDSNGNFGIGMNPSMTLDVIRGTGTNGTARFAGTNYPTQFNYGAAENTYISGGLAGSNIMMHYFGGANVGIGQGMIPSSTFEVARGTGIATAFFHGSTYHSIFNSGSNEETYIRGGKTNADVYINDVNSGKVRIGGNSTPLATLDVSRGTATNGTASFRGTSFNSYFNYDTTENTYINGGKANSNILLNFFGGANVGIGANINPVATLDVLRGTGHWGTAAFRGTNYVSHFNFDTTENTYIRGGKNYSDVYINDINGGDVKIGGGGLPPIAALDVSRNNTDLATAVVRGTKWMTSFNYNSTEDTYINGGKDSSLIVMSQSLSSKVVLGNHNYNVKLSVAKENTYGTAVFEGSNYVSYFNYGPAEGTNINGGIAGAPVTLNAIPDGKVGIGMVPTLADGVLDVNGRMRIRSGGNPAHTAGLWLNKTDNSSLATFIGMEDDEHVGFYGLPAGFKFSMNTTTGALKINGSEGNAGEILTSNGSSGSPSWKSGPGSLFDNSVSYAQSGSVNIICTNCSATMITASAAPLIITKNAKILLSYSGLIEPQATGIIVPDSRVNINLSIVAEDGSIVVSDNYKTIGYKDWGGTNFSKTTNLLYLTPGNYHMVLQATLVDGVTTQFKSGIITTVVMQQ